MLGDKRLPSKDNIPKRTPDLNTGSPKRRKQNETDKSGAAFPQPEKQGSSSDRVLSIPGPERMDIDDYQDSATSSQENMDTSTKGSDTPAQELIDLQKSFAENVLLVDVDFSKKASKEEAGLSNVLEAETAMRNTCGGVIILNIKNKDVQQGVFANRDKWLSKLAEIRNRKLSQVKNPDTFDEILDFKNEKCSLIFVRKSSIVLTEESKCILQRCETRNQRVTSYPEICRILAREKKRCRCRSDQRKLTSFILGNKMPFPESKTAEFKHLTGKDLPTSLRDELRDNIVAFANTAGGTIYFGIKDDASILGQKVNKEEENTIYRKIEECVISKLWMKDSGEEIVPEKGHHYRYEFFPVDGAEDNTFVIEIHICEFAGTVFSGQPTSPVLNEDNKIVNMDLKNWMDLHKSSLTGNSDYQQRFDKKKRGSSTYYSVKETVDKFVADLTSAPPGQLKLHPFHAVKWINHPALNAFVKTTKKAFEKSMWHSGIAYIERCWEVNLGLSSTKPEDVICDILLCCPQLPLIFVTLTKSDTSDEASAYNKKVAARLKNTLVQEADCLDKFYVKPVVISRRQLEVEDGSRIYSEIPLYPKAYRMTNNKYSNILQALVLVLARSNAMSSLIVGKGLFNLLTYEQYNILHESYEESPKLKITGPPGSGKTVLALERIHRLRNEGSLSEEVLFLCSNKPLKAKVENMKTRDGQSLCIVKTYYEVDSLVRTDVSFNKELGNVKHILADETQNFQGDTYLDHEWWDKLHDLCDAREDSSFWVFFDVAQKINNNRSVSLRRFSRKELKTVIRQTGNVHRFITSKYMRVDPQVKLGHDFDGPNVDFLVPSDQTQTHLVYILISQLHNLIIKDGHHINDITVLFNDGKQKELYESLFVQHTDNSCPVRNGEEVEKHGVVFDTIRRYCGVDDNIIIGFCPKYYPSGFQNNRALMTALCSRTKLKLILILENVQQAECFKLGHAAGLKTVKLGNIREVSNFSRH